MRLPSTVERVPLHTPGYVNRAIQRATECSLIYYGLHLEEIPGRLEELDREWDIERVLEANGSALVLAGLTLGLTVSRKFLGLPMLVGGFLLQHALQGWSPALTLLRRLGFRTQGEIEIERLGLLALQERALCGP